MQLRAKGGTHVLLLARLQLLLVLALRVAHSLLGELHLFLQEEDLALRVLQARA